MDSTPHTRSGSIVLARALRVLAGLALFLGAVVVVPLAWSFAVPINPSPLVSWAYAGFSALVAASVVVSEPDGRGSRIALVVVAVCLLIPLVAIPLTGLVIDRAVNRVFPGFSAVLSDSPEVASPSGRLWAGQEYVDSGATGGQTTIWVHGRLLPGLFEWSWVVPGVDDDSRQDVTWVDDQTLSVNGRLHAVPWIVARFSW